LASIWWKVRRSIRVAMKARSSGLLSMRRGLALAMRGAVRARRRSRFGPFDHTPASNHLVDALEGGNRARIGELLVAHERYG